jgi:hypothetical protein
VTVIFLDAHSLHAFYHWCGRILIDNECAGAFEVGRLGFVEEVDVEPADNLDEEAIDVLEGFIIGLQGGNQLWCGVEELFGQSDGAKLLEQ